MFCIIKFEYFCGVESRGGNLEVKTSTAAKCSPANQQNRSLSNTDCCFFGFISEPGVFQMQEFMDWAFLIFSPFNFPISARSCFRFDLWSARSRFFAALRSSFRSFQNGFVPRFDGTSGHIERKRVNNSGIYMFFSS